MPDLPSDPAEMMALLGDLNSWLTRVLNAYGYSDISPAQKSAIEDQVRLMFDDDFPIDSHVVSWGGPAPLPPGPFNGFPCHLYATPILDDLIGTIENQMTHGE